MSTREITTSKAPKAIGPYSQAIVSGDLIYCSGQIGLDPSTTELVGGGITFETKQVLSNIKEILEEAGSRIENIIKTDIYLSDLKNFEIVNTIYGEFFNKEPYPARATIEVGGLPKGALIEIVCIATLKK